MFISKILSTEINAEIKNQYNELNKNSFGLKLNFFVTLLWLSTTDKESVK